MPSHERRVKVSHAWHGSTRDSRTAHPRHQHIERGKRKLKSGGVTARRLHLIFARACVSGLCSCVLYDHNYKMQISIVPLTTHTWPADRRFTMVLKLKT